MSGAVLGVDEGAAAGRDDDVPQRQEVEEHGALDRAEVRLALAREDGRDRAPLARFDALVDVLDPPVEPLAERARQRRLAGAHEPDQVDLVGRHAVSDSSVSKNPGYETLTASAPVMVDGPLGAERRDGERHRQAMVAGGVGRAAASRRAAGDVEAVGELLDLAAERRKPRPERADAVALLDAQLRGAGHVQLAAEGASAASAGSSSITPGTSAGAEDQRLQRSWRTDRTRAARFAVSRVGGDLGSTSAPARRSTSKSAMRERFRPTSVDLDLRARQPRGGDGPEGRRRHIAGHGASNARSGAPPVIADPAVAAGVDRGPERAERQLRMIPCRRRLADRGRAVGLQAGQQHGALHLGARDRGRVVDGGERAAGDGERARGPASAAIRAPIARERLDDAAHRAAAEGGVAGRAWP